MEKTASESSFGDVRDVTHSSRLAIGFREREHWRTAKAHFDDHSLVIEGHPVMEDWEDGYMEALAAIASSEGGAVLEVGFGMGISARHIQKRNVARHIIVEANADVYKKLELFAKEHPTVEPLFGFWEDMVSSIPSGSISGILFDTYPLSEGEIHQNHFPFFVEAHRLLQKGGVLTYYSDEIDSFSEQHLKLLTDAGFTNIAGIAHKVEPPAECAYWKSNTLLAPIIQK